MRTHQYAHKKRASQSFRTPVPRPSEVQSLVQPSPIQAKSNEEGLAEHAERLRKFQRLGNSMIQMGPPRLGNDEASPLQPKPWIQRKLTIGEPGDKYEQEADRVASQVVQQINTPASKENNLRQSIQREKDLEGEMQAKCFRAAIQRKQAIAGGEASTDLESAINRARGSGQPLDAGLQQSMGEAMGADFSGVRVHTNAQADQLNQSIQAKAFTMGQDVFFREGAYQPGNRKGQELIAHKWTRPQVTSQGRLQDIEINDQKIKQDYKLKEIVKNPKTQRQIQRKEYSIDRSKNFKLKYDRFSIYPKNDVGFNSTLNKIIDYPCSIQEYNTNNIIQRELKESDEKKNHYYVDHEKDILYEKTSLSYLEEGPVYKRGDHYYHYNPKADRFKEMIPAILPEDPIWEELNTVFNKIIDLPKKEASPPPPPPLSDSTIHEIIRNRIGYLPESIEEKFPGGGLLSSVEKYIVAQEGVFILKNIANERIVVKGSNAPVKEYFGEEMADKLGLRHPHTKLIKSASSVGKTIIKNLHNDENYKKKYGKGPPKYFFIMTFVDGFTLTDDKIKENEDLFKDRPKNDYLRLLDEIGTIAAFDVILSYKDRTPIMSGGNLENIMICAKTLKAVAIDQALRVTSELVGINFIMGLSSHLEQTLKVMTDIFEGFTVYAKRLWKGLPNRFKEIYYEELGWKDADGERQTHIALVEGFQKISKGITLKDVNEISKKLESMSTKTDKIDLKALEKVLKILQKLVNF